MYFRVVNQSPPLSEDSPMRLANVTLMRRSVGFSQSSAATVKGDVQPRGNRWQLLQLNFLRC